jgi:hypothetical protein
MPTSKSNHWCLIKIDLCISFELKHVNLGVKFHLAFLAIVRKTVFTADSGTLMTAGKQASTALVAWKTVARC